jgi:hypothetical protein
VCAFPGLPVTGSHGTVTLKNPQHPHASHSSSNHRLSDPIAQTQGSPGAQPGPRTPREASRRRSSATFSYAESNASSGGELEELYRSARRGLCEEPVRCAVAILMVGRWRRGLCA